MFACFAISGQLSVTRLKGKGILKVPQGLPR